MVIVGVLAVAVACLFAGSLLIIAVAESMR
jgi:hypothetical protein